MDIKAFEALIEYNKNQKLKSKKIPLWLTIDEVAYYLRKSKRTIQRYIYDGTLESKKIGGRRYVPASALVKFFENVSGEK